jgi:NhaP-type Na+/H+ or K+/H+ antiporter
VAASSNLLVLVAAIVGVGIVAQVLSDRFQVPSVVFLIAAGILLGPEGLGNWVPGIEPLVTGDSFGGALPAIVGLSVAIIVFEGAFHTNLDTLREAPKATVRLVTVGAAIAFLGTTLAVKLFLPAATWPIAALVGSLLVATGPTVIAPILEVVPVRDRVGAALDAEGIINDVTAAILAIVIFEGIRTETSAPIEFVQLFAERLGVGILVGAVVAGVIYYALNHVDLSPGNAPQNARLLTLAGALAAYAAADAIFTEAGIAAVATAGVMLGNADIPYEQDIAEFKGDVTLIVLSFVFIALAALLTFEDLLALGVGGVAVVLAVALVIRPAVVLLSTVGLGDRFTLNERLFMSFVGPRGIIPASVATLFAVELRALGLETGANVLVGTVFLVILATVVFEAGFARHIAEYLDVIPMRVIIVGGGRVGQALATRLEDRGENVVIVEQDESAVETARNAGHTVHIGDGTDTDELRSAGAGNARIVVAASGDDDVNLLVAQLANSKFGVETVIARANNPDNVEAFEDLGVRTISSTLATAWAMDNSIERPAMSSWMTDVDRQGAVQEIELRNSELDGRSVQDIGPELPAGCLITLVARDDEVWVPEADSVLEVGDRVTVIGNDDAVQEAMALCGGEGS